MYVVYIVKPILRVQRVISSSSIFIINGQFITNWLQIKQIFANKKCLLVNNSFISSPIRLIFSDQIENFAALIIVWRLSVWHAPINSYKQLNNERAWSRTIKFFAFDDWILEWVVSGFRMRSYKSRTWNMSLL